MNMVAIHNIPLDEFAGGSAAGAVTLSLSAPSRHDRLRRFQTEGWEVELRRGCDHVVARTAHSLAGAALLDAAIGIVHRSLDLTSVEDRDHLVTQAPASNNTMLNRADGRSVLRYQSVSDFPIETSAQVTILGADGTIEPQPISTPLVWTPAFRFCRLSQGSRNLFDAYRNMFLGLEALLDQLFPKGRSEGEKAWLLRAVAAAGAKVDLQRLATAGAADAAGDLVDRLYGVRVRLFHAKTGRTLIPDERVSYTAVAEAYPVLVALWTEIVRAWLSPSRGGGAITRQGFRHMIEKAYASLRIGITADATPPSDAEQSPSPFGLPLFTFSEPISVIERRPGCMALCGQTKISALPVGQVVGRVIAVLEDSRPAIVSSITGGLTLDGADVFETILMVRLINLGQPRTEFL